jgi:hypothetical protein
VEFGVLGIGYIPISNTVYVLDGDGEVLLCVEGLCVWIVLKTKPLIVDEFNGFEGVGCRNMLGDIVSVIVSVPLDGSFYMSRKIVLGLPGDGGSLVIWSEGDL